MKTSRKGIGIWIAALCCIAGLGCKHANSKLVGTWIQAPDPLFSNPPEVKLTFEGDGTFEAKASSPEGSITQGGTYATTDGTSVTFHCNRYDMRAADPAKQMQANADKPEIVKLLKDPFEVKVTWDSPTEFKIEGLPGPLMMGGTFNKK